jgi:hypothetical protein
MYRITSTLLLLLALGAPASVVQAQEPEAATVSATVSEEAPAEVKPPIWAGSTLTYRNAATALSTSRSAELTYNPYYEMSLTAAPVLRLHDKVNVGLQASVSRELTNSDYTTRRGEFEWSDLTLRFGFPGIYTIPVAEIRISADLPFAFPTSRISRARTTIVAMSPGISLSRRFDVLSGITLRYGLRGTYWWNRYETGQYERPTIDGCVTDCAQFRAMESLNTTWRIANSFGLDVAFIEQLSLGISFAVVRDDVGQPPVADVSFVPITPTDARFSNSAGVALTWQAIDALALTLGAETAHPQLRPGPGEYYAPFFNRYTVTYLDATLDFGALIPRREP